MPQRRRSTGVARPAAGPTVGDMIGNLMDLARRLLSLGALAALGYVGYEIWLELEAALPVVEEAQSGKGSQESLFYLLSASLLMPTIVVVTGLVLGLVYNIVAAPLSRLLSDDAKAYLLPVVLAAAAAGLHFQQALYLPHILGAQATLMEWVDGAKSHTIIQQK